MREFGRCPRPSVWGGTNEMRVAFHIGFNEVPFYNKWKKIPWHPIHNCDKRVSSVVVQSLPGFFARCLAHASGVSDSLISIFFWIPIKSNMECSLHAIRLGSMGECFVIASIKKCVDWAKDEVTTSSSGAHSNACLSPHLPYGNKVPHPRGTTWITWTPLTRDSPVTRLWARHSPRFAIYVVGAAAMPCHYLPLLNCFCLLLLYLYLFSAIYVVGAAAMLFFPPSALSLSILCYIYWSDLSISNRPRLFPLLLLLSLCMHHHCEN